MNLLDENLKKVKADMRLGLSLFITAGYPTLNATSDIILTLAELGVDFFEVGYPFSDPIADGPIIQKSSEVALQNGMNWDRLLRLSETVRYESDIPLVLMSYANPLYHRSWGASAKELFQAGFNGLIVPDLIIDESTRLKKEVKDVGLDLIQLLAPTSKNERVKRIGRESMGFIYCVSVTGVTGARSRLPSTEIKAFLKSVKQTTTLPTYLGFGISDPSQAKIFNKDVDGIIIGSKFIQFITDKRNLNRKKLKSFIQPFIEVLQK